LNEPPSTLNLKENAIYSVNELNEKTKWVHFEGGLHKCPSCNKFIAKYNKMLDIGKHADFCLFSFGRGKIMIKKKTIKIKDKNLAQLLKELNIEGNIGEGSGSGGTVTIMDVLGAITDYLTGRITVLELLDIIEQYKQGF